MKLCYVAAWMEEGFRREWIHVYVWLSPFTFLLKLSRDLLSYTQIQSRKFKSERKKKKNYSTTSFLFVIMYVERFLKYSVHGTTL